MVSPMEISTCKLSKKTTIEMDDKRNDMNAEE